jgi:hypothetical protein
VPSLEAIRVKGSLDRFGAVEVVVILSLLLITEGEKGISEAAVMLMIVVKVSTMMARRKADLRLAQLLSQAIVKVKGKILCQPLYAPMAYPRIFPMAMHNEKKALARRDLR